MYQVESAKILLERRGVREGVTARFHVGRTVLMLGLTSLFTDLSSEMVAAILPLYLMYGIGLSPLQFGAVDGLQNGAAGLVRLIGGGLGDRLQRHKEVAAAGYALSALTRPAFLLAGSAFSAIGAIVFVDRVGKGIRTAPRDALISLSVPPERLGTAFGVHRALDTVGAMLGPLAAFLILSAAPESYDAVFVASTAAAIVGVAIIVLLVQPDRGRRTKPDQPRIDVGSALGLFRIPAFGGLMVAGTALATVTISDAFVYLRLQHSLGFDIRFLPLLYVATACCYMLLAIPLGSLADRVGRQRVFLGGYCLLLGVYAVLLTQHGPLVLVLALPLFGAYYAATDGVLAAAATAVLPEYARGTGLSLLSTLTSLGRFGASVVFGAFWVTLSGNAAVGIFAIALIAALAFSAVVLRRADAAV